MMAGYSLPGLIHQLCTQHILRDLAGAAETYPDAHWPVQISQALQELIHAANTARAQGLPAIPGQGRRAPDPRVQARRPARPVPDSPRPSPQTAALPRPAGMPARPAGRHAPLHHRPADPAHLQPGRTRSETRQDPAEDIRPAPLRAGHPRPVRHPRLHLHRRQARRPRPDRHPTTPSPATPGYRLSPTRRKPLTHRLTPPPTAKKAHRGCECLRYRGARR